MFSKSFGRPRAYRGVWRGCTGRGNRNRSWFGLEFLWLASGLLDTPSCNTRSCLGDVFLYKFTSYLGHFSVITVLLVGIAINAFSTIGIMGFQYLSDDAQLRSLIFWLMGSFARAEWETVIPAGFIILLGVIMLYRQTRALDRLQLGESQAFHLGVNVRKLQRFIILLTAVSVGVGVALSGIVGFVGLVVPHLIRLTLGVTHTILVPASAILGAALMISADLASRTLIAPIELPVGIVTSAIGAPFFLWLIARAKH